MQAKLPPNSPSSCTEQVRLLPLVQKWFVGLQPDILHQFQARPARESIGQTKREQEFSFGRMCAASVLGQLNAPTYVGINLDRSPKWPEGFAGSISHSNHWIWAAAANQEKIQSIGIDTEPVVSHSTRIEIEHEVATLDEWCVAKQAGLSVQQTFSLVFSAKEAFYKCWYPLNPEYFEFKDVAVDFVTSDRVRIRFLPSNPNFGCQRFFLDVFYIATEQDVFTMTWIERE